MPYRDLLAVVIDWITSNQITSTFKTFHKTSYVGVVVENTWLYLNNNVSTICYEISCTISFFLRLFVTDFSFLLNVALNIYYVVMFIQIII